MTINFKFVKDFNDVSDVLLGTLDGDLVVFYRNGDVEVYRGSEPLFDGGYLLVGKRQTTVYWGDGDHPQDHDTWSEITDFAVDILKNEPEPPTVHSSHIPDWAIMEIKAYKG